MFQIVVLYVEEKESVERQLKRGRETVAHNERVRETGVGSVARRARDRHERGGVPEAVPRLHGADLRRAPDASRRCSTST
jgi:hypothetical protein